MNGQQNGVSQQPIEQKLMGVLTEGYRPAWPYWAAYMTEGQTFPQFYLRREIELMLIHPTVLNALDYYKGALAGAEFEGPKGVDGQPKPISQNPALADFIVSQCRRFWDRGLHKIQNGYEYGWIALENVYHEQQGGELDGLMTWEDCLDFHPLDCFLLTQDARPVGARIMNVVKPSDHVGARRDLWFSDGMIPAKALWYAHRPRYNRYYGQSQLIGAWKPWRRLAWKDAAETVLDGGFYRAGFGGPMVRYPEQTMTAPVGTPDTTQNSQGIPQRYARDMAREMSQWAKAGAGIGLPSTCYPEGSGGAGKPMWEFEWQDTHFNGDPLLAYINYLIKQVREGVGVPSELIEAAETGSGYSGRAIPLEGFLQKQQVIAGNILHLFDRQVLKPLVQWNAAYFQQFGPLDYEVCVANLLETKLKAAMNQGGAEPGMRTGGAQQPGQGGEDAGANGMGGAGVTWQQFTDEQGSGWKSTGGLVRRTQTPPGQLAGAMSLDSNLARIRAISDKIIALARRAA